MQVRHVPIMGGAGRHQARVALSPSGESMFSLADTGNPTSLRKPGRKPWSKGKVRSFVNLRLSGLRKLVLGRHNGPCDTHDGEAYYMAALPHLVAKCWAYGVEEERIGSREWAGTWAPTLLAEKPAAWFEQHEQRVLLAFDNHDGHPSLPSADDFARALGITAAEVRLYDLRTIGAVDRLAEQRLADEREADRQYQAAKRASKGATPREQSTTARQPWKAYGISRPAYYRRLKLGQLRETVSSGETDSSEAKGLVANPRPQDLSPPVAMGLPVPANDDAPQDGMIAA